VATAVSSSHFLPIKDSEFIKVITEIRCVGKSVLLMLCKEYLLEEEVS
jgi:predicted AAA+ superfamily ATPase